MAHGCGQQLCQQGVRTFIERGDSHQGCDRVLQVLLQSVLRPGAWTSGAALGVGVNALLAAAGGAVEGAAAANPGQPQVSERSCGWSAGSTADIESISEQPAFCMTATKPHEVPWMAHAP